MEDKKHIVVLGGGFAGVEAVFRLRKLGHKVTLVSDKDYCFIYPISIWIPVNKISFDDAKLSLKKLQKVHKFNLVIDKVEEIISKDNKVILSGQTISYDYLIVTVGGSKLQIEGIEHTFSTCGKPEKLIELREQINILLKRGYGNIAIGFGGNPLSPTGVRGGPAFEILFNIVTLLKERKLYKNFKITFFAPMKQPGARMGGEGLKMLSKMYEKHEIEQKIGVPISRFEKNKVVFDDGFELNSDLIIYTPAGTGHPVLKNSDLPLSLDGSLLVDGYCRVHGQQKNVYAAGDVARLEGPKWIAKQGHIAEIMANYAVYNINNEILGNPKRKGYQNHLNIVCVMDSGSGAIFTKRSWNKELIIPMPTFGHWVKKAWGHYWKLSKLKKIPRIPGM
jgi:sulfide:quinone oxidoreductase